MCCVRLIEEDASTNAQDSELAKDTEATRQSEATGKSEATEGVPSETASGATTDLPVQQLVQVEKEKDGSVAEGGVAEGGVAEGGVAEGGVPKRDADTPEETVGGGEGVAGDSTPNSVKEEEKHE